MSELETCDTEYALKRAVDQFSPKQIGKGHLADYLKKDLRNVQVQFDGPWTPALVGRQCVVFSGVQSSVSVRAARRTVGQKSGSSLTCRNISSQPCMQLLHEISEAVNT